MIAVVGAIALGLALATLVAWAVARTELRSGRPLRFTWRLCLSGVQAYLSTWAIVQIAAGQVFAEAPFEGRAAELATFVKRVTLAGTLAWAPLALTTLAIGLLAARRGDRDALVAPLVAAATYAVALFALFGSGWLTGTLG